MRVYKLTDQNGYTRAGHSNACLWGPGVRHSGTGKGGLCSSGYIHAYTSPLLAILLNPIHADINCPRLWECDGSGKMLSNNGLKVGFVYLTTQREITLPVITPTQRIAFAILCAKNVCDDPTWNLWADRWLDGTDRSTRTARTAWAARAAEAAAWAAEAAAWAAWAAEAAARAAGAAARAAEAAEAVYDLDAIAEQAMKY